MRYLKNFLFIIVFSFAALFFFQNFEVAAEKFKIGLGFEPYRYQWLVYNGGIILASFALGIFVSLLLGFFSGNSARSELKRSRKTIKKLEEKVGELEVELLQNQPQPQRTEQSSKPSVQTMFSTPK